MQSVRVDTSWWDSVSYRYLLHLLMSCFTRPYTIHGQECKPRLVSWAPTKNRQDHYESSKRMIKGDDKKLVTIEDQFMNCTGMMVRSYNPSGHKYQKKLSSTRLDIIASDHHLPRISISRGIRDRSQSRTRFGSNGNLIPDSVSSGLFRSLSVPDISSISTEVGWCHEMERGISISCWESKERWNSVRLFLINCWWIIRWKLLKLLHLYTSS